ncbi:RidA family protein [Microbacterium sp. NPDC055312]
MTVHLFTPEGLAPDTPYRQVAVGTGSRHVHVAGQVAMLPDGTISGGDLAAQVGRALRNTAIGLTAAGAALTDVVRLTFYVVDWTPEKMADLMQGMASVADDIGLPSPLPPASLIGVSRLFQPGVLVEIEATAIVD